MLSDDSPLPSGQQLVAPGKWPIIGEREPGEGDVPWTVVVAGRVARPAVWTLDELKGLPSRALPIDIHCVTRWSKLAVEFRGVLLADLIQQAQPLNDACFVSLVARSQRGHATSLPLQVIRDSNVLVAWEADGDPLAVAHGGPLRVVVPSRYFYKSLKWLARVEVLVDDRLGFWESTAGYHNTGDPWRQQRYIAPNLTKQQARTILQKRDFRKRDLRGIDAGRFDLTGLQAEDALLRNANFQAATLRSANFDRANLSNAKFQNADLREASFVRADLEGADLSGADLRGAVFRDASLVAATFVATTTAGAEYGARIDTTTHIDRRVLEVLTPEQAGYIARQMNW